MRKYYTSFDEMIIGIRKDLEVVFDVVCKELCEELNDLLFYYIYEQKAENVDVYKRTFQMTGIVDYKKIGSLNAEFYYDERLITTIDNPFHNMLEQGGTMEQMVDVASWGRDEDIRAYIVKRFPQLCRIHMKQLN